MFWWRRGESMSAPAFGATAASHTTASGMTSSASTGHETCNSTEPRVSGRRRSAQHPLDIRLHGLQLATPVAPAVGAVGREVEHPVAASGPRVRRLEVLVGADRQALQELRGNLRVAQSGIEIRGIAVAAVYPDPGAVGHQPPDLQHGVVTLPGRSA